MSSSSEVQQNMNNQVETSTSKIAIRSVEDKPTLGSEQNNHPNQNIMKTDDTILPVSDQTNEDDIDIDCESEDSKFKHIRCIDMKSSTGEGRISERTSPSSKKIEKSGTGSSAHSGEENLSVHFGVEEIIETDVAKFEYEPDDIPLKSILKSDLNRSRNISFDVRILKDIEGKLISHDDLSQGEKDEDRSESILNDELLGDEQNSQSVSNKDSEEDEDDYIDNYEEQKQQYRQQRHDSEVRFKIQKQDNLSFQNELIEQAETSNQKRNSLLFPTYSILKNSPLVQPSEFKALKNIDKISHNPKDKIESDEDEEEQKQEDAVTVGESIKNDQTAQILPHEQKLEEQLDVRFVGDIVFQDSNAYKFKYNPEENPKRPSIKRGSCLMTTSAHLHGQASGQSVGNVVQLSHSAYHPNSQGVELQIRKRKSYDFHNLKNVEGKLIKHLQDEKQQVDPNEDCALEEIDREIKFGDTEIVDLQEPEKPIDQLIHTVNKSAKPSKTILKPIHSSNSGRNERSSSCDFKRAIKNIDGVYLRKCENTKSTEEEEKIVHFSSVIEEGNNNKTNEFTMTASIIESEKHDTKSILKRSMSLQGSLGFNLKESTPKQRKSSNFGVRHDFVTEIKEIQTIEAFQANWTSIRNDYIESAYKFLITRIDPLKLLATFPKGMDDTIFNQIIEILYEKRGQEGEFTNSLMSNLQKIKNFPSLIQKNLHQQDCIQEILSSLRASKVIDQSHYHKLKSHYIYKQ